jgi:hypothetical protein
VRPLSLSCWLLLARIKNTLFDLTHLRLRHSLPPSALLPWSGVASASLLALFGGLDQPIEEDYRPLPLLGATHHHHHHRASGEEGVPEADPALTGLEERASSTSRLGQFPFFSCSFTPLHALGQVLGPVIRVCARRFFLTVFGGLA